MKPLSSVIISLATCNFCQGHKNLAMEEKSSFLALLNIGYCEVGDTMTGIYEVMHRGRG